MELEYVKKSKQLIQGITAAIHDEKCCRPVNVLLVWSGSGPGPGLRRLI